MLSESAKALKARLLLRLRRYIDGLRFGDPVRGAEIVWAIMNEPGIADVHDLKLLRYPPGFDAVDFGSAEELPDIQKFDCGQNVRLQTNQIAVLVDDPSGLEVI